VGLVEGFDLDPDALRERYRLEREKRLRADGPDQYLEVKGALARYVEEDPYLVELVEREPVTDEVNVVIIGGGFSGLLASARLIDAGVDDFHMIEAGSDFGGTWYWNRYPGAQCDIESYCYLPLLEELGYMPKEKYSFGDEIYEHSQRIGRHYGLYEKTWFQTRVESVDWDDDLQRWHIATNRGDDIKASFVIFALGPASRPKLPGVEGITTFEGHSFHTARWDYGYTGGNPDGGMTGLSDKRVAIIGTGATAIQCIPRTAQYARHLYVFQRTPSSVDVRGNAPTDPDWWKTLQPGWQRDRRYNFACVLAGKEVEEDLVRDGWTDMARTVRAVQPDTPLSDEELEELMELADFAKMSQIRRRVEEAVADPMVAEALKPYYRQMCKRPTFNDEFLPAFNRDNVTLVDVAASKGIDCITSKGVVANGVEYEVDCIIYASGFEITHNFERRLGLQVNGRNGVSLFERWGDGITTLHGFMTREFPNWFHIGLSQNAVSVNMTQMFDEQAEHVAYLIAETIKLGHTTLEPTEEAERRWVELIDSLQLNRSFMDSCTPGYYNNEGDPSAPGIASGVYTPGINSFNRLLAKWRAEGGLSSDLEFDRTG
jgi:cyclohexanone monooxygenase